MKALQIFTAIMLLSVACVVDSHSTAIINLSGGDEVNAKDFTIVAKGEDFAAGQLLRIEVRITDLNTGEVYSDTTSVITK